MTRLFADVVQVRRRDEEPTEFLWRGRTYLVQEVLAHWVEAGRWWATPAVAALSSGDSSPPGDRPAPLSTAPIPSSPKWAQRAWGEPAPDVGAAVGPAGLDDAEQQWWRVEAASSRAGSASSAGSGVYDLCLTWSTSTWTLARVVD